MQGKTVIDAEGGAVAERHLSTYPGNVGDKIHVGNTGLLGFDRVEHVPKSSYKDCSMVIIVPSRDEYLHKRFVERMSSMMWSMNGRRAMFYVTGAEVGRAYTEQIAAVLAHPDLSKWQYVLTVEDDNLPPVDGVQRLLESIEAGPFDGVGGLYFTRGDVNMPMCYGDPVEYARTGVLDFRPRDVSSVISSGGILPCNGIAMGFSLYRMQLFKDVPGPWFVTVSDLTPEGPKSYTQDLYFCEKAVRMGKRFAVDCRVRVAHCDWATGVDY